jgi:hypothetical protein
METSEFVQGVVIDAGYIDWQTKRISFILETYGVDFFLKESSRIGMFLWWCLSNVV